MKNNKKFSLYYMKAVPLIQQNLNKFAAVDIEFSFIANNTEELFLLKNLDRCYKVDYNSNSIYKNCVYCPQESEESLLTTKILAHDCNSVMFLTGTISENCYIYRKDLTDNEIIMYSNNRYLLLTLKNTLHIENICKNKTEVVTIEHPAWLTIGDECTVKINGNNLKSEILNDNFTFNLSTTDFIAPAQEYFNNSLTYKTAHQLLEELEISGEKIAAMENNKNVFNLDWLPEMSFKKILKLLLLCFTVGICKNKE